MPPLPGDRRYAALTHIATTVRGWECAVARSARGCWAVVWDGATAHEGVMRTDEADARLDIASIINSLEGLAAVARAAATAGSN